MSSKRVLQLVVILVVVGLLMPRLRAGQAQAGDPLTALLAEVHSLRLAMEQQASVGPRMQLTLARLTIEEQRITHLNAELDGVRKELAAASADRERLGDELIGAERSVQAEVADPARRSVLEAHVDYVKREISRRTTVEQQFRSRENDTLQTISAEQARWMDLNARLDELERQLGSARQ